ncbi:polymorphic toxin-type HINT domain-containing protein [Promicromonospora sp. CA-289599]|uniref:polymorphic toxin-type HINT domain-containing protein n=1 Tax=Promicromonospora sp. CA-289599 TaxID=3240014 RepID=UPI003D8CDD60
MVTITAVAVVMTGCTRATDAPPPTSTDGGGTPVVDAGSELEKLPDVEQFLEQAVAQVRQKYPDQVPEDFTAASIMGELDAIDSHVQADGVLDYAAATSDPAITADTLDPYARTYRALGGELTGVKAADADAASGNDTDATAQGPGSDDTSPTSVEHVSTVRFQTADEVQAEKEKDDPRVGYQGPRQFVSDRPEWVDDYPAVGDEILRGKVLYFEAEYSLARMRFSAELDNYLSERVGEDQTVLFWGEIMDGPLGACIVSTEVYDEQVFEQDAEASEICLTRTVSGSTVPEPLLPLDSPIPEPAVAIEADVQQLIIQELWPIVKDFIGLTDLEKCFTEADILACMMTLINLLPVGKAIKVVKAIPAVVRAVEKIVTFVATKGKKLPVAVPAGCFASFAGSTPVLMADGTHQPIRDVRPGDYVHATDPVSGVNGPRRVIDTFVHPDMLVDLRLASGARITTTADHPFWSSTDRTFEDAKDLALGEKVLSADGTELAVGGLDTGAVREGAAYNLAVLDLHTYHVGDAEVLVHNSGCLAVLKNWKPKTFRYGNTTLVLQRGRMQHILERHHPTYFDPEQARLKNDFFRESRTPDEIVGLIDEVVRQRTDELAAIARRSKPEQQRGEVEATIDGVTYLLAVKQGAIRSFFPVGGE